MIRRLAGGLLAAAVTCGPSALAQAGAAPPAGADAPGFAEAIVEWMDAYAAVPPPTALDELRAFTPGWFDNVEVRTETDDFEPSRQRYSLRVRPKMPHVRRAERELQRRLRERVVGEGTEAEGEAYGDALARLFEWSIDQREALLLDTLIEVQRLLVDATKARLAEPEYDVEKVLDAEDELAAAQLRQRELRAITADVAPPVPFGSLVAVAEIGDRLETLSRRGPTAVDADAELAAIDAEAQLEQAENLQWIDFLGLDYRGGSDEVREAYQVGASLRLPRRRRNLRDVHELEIERLEERYAVELEARERRREFDDAVAELRRAIANYAALRQQHVEQNARRRRLRGAYLGNRQTRPEDLIRLRRRDVRGLLDLLAVEEEIREDWADLLADFVTLDAGSIRAYVLR